jgi:signal transduction histidine kinase
LTIPSHSIKSLIQIFQLKESQIETDLKQAIKKKVQTAYQISLTVYQTYKHTENEKDVKRLIEESVQLMRSKNGRNFFILAGSDWSYKILSSREEEVERSSEILSTIHNKKGFLRFVKKAKLQGDGIFKYDLSRSTSAGEKPDNILIFIKWFDPLKMHIGMSARVNDARRKVQKTMLKEIMTAKKDTDNCSQTNGICNKAIIYELTSLGKKTASMKVLFDPGDADRIGQKLSINDTDQKGNYYVRSILTNLKRDQEAFVKYWCRKPGVIQPEARLCFFKFFPEWNWVLSKGFYLNDLQKLSIQKISDLEKNIWTKIKFAAGLFGLFLALAIAISYYFSKGISTIFSNYSARVEKANLAMTEKNLELLNEIHEREKIEISVRESREQLRLLASEVQLSEEKERRRIADDLHDSIGPTLVISNLKLEMLSSEISSSLIKKNLDEVYKNIKQVIQQTRSLIFQLSPPSLYTMGLEAALSGLVEQTELQYELNAVFEDDQQSKSLNMDVRIHIFRSVRELLVNVIKHADAKNVKVSVSKEAEQIKIVVADDGIGFDINKKKISTDGTYGFGLFSIRERLSLLGGQLLISSAPKNGTEITLKAPLNQNVESTF